MTTRNPLEKPYGLRLTDADGRTGERWFATEAERMAEESIALGIVWKVERVERKGGKNAVV